MYRDSTVSNGHMLSGDDLTGEQLLEIRNAQPKQSSILQRPLAPFEIIVNFI